MNCFNRLDIGKEKKWTIVPKENKNIQTKIQIKNKDRKYKRSIMFKNLWIKLKNINRQKRTSGKKLELT